ncbi:transposase [Acinetobacter sp. ME22]|uniref:transposase n=1 Tax=Acinetobacter sp. ME22 TaxID=2904802 RepID=UPI003FA45EA8
MRENKSFDPYLYRLRNLVENVFSNLKQFRVIATRFDEFSRNYQSEVFIAYYYVD